MLSGKQQELFMTTPKKRNRKRFSASQSQDFKIEDDNGTIGHIRVKPSGVLWKPSGSHNWYGLTLEKFGELAEKHGREQDK